MTENELAAIAVEICFKIHRDLGPGLLESIYEAAFVYELEQLGIPYTRQEIINVVYKGQFLGPAFKSDIILENKLIVELKSVERLENVHHKILLNYMKLKKIKLGFLINFNVALIKEGIHRKILGQLED